MARNIAQTFSAKDNQVEEFYTDWGRIYTELTDILGNGDSAAEEGYVDFTGLETRLRDAFGELREGLEKPSLTLATTGTTSGGKSSLVNFLCGAPLMPVAVQEMSAGVVVIEHNPDKISLKIPSVQGLEEHAFEQEFPTNHASAAAEDIRERLQRFMHALLDLRKENKSYATPHIQVQFPTRLGADKIFAGLPRETTLRILDLPGYKSTVDDYNKDIIRQEGRKALCLVAYNSENPDEKFQQQLIYEVIGEVRRLGGSPARMMFLLNRIDAFRRDEDWQNQTEKFKITTTKKIREALTEELPEYSNEVEDIEAHPMSTLPALYAWQALDREGKEQTRSLEAIDKNFSCLIPDDLKEDLPRRIEKWGSHDRKRVAKAVWIASYGAALDPILQKHIDDNFPQLILPPLLEPVYLAAKDALDQADQVAHAQITVIEQRFDSEMQRLDNVEQKLEQNCHDADVYFEGIIKQFSGASDKIPKLTDMARELEQRFNLGKQKLAPLYDWSNKLGNAIERLCADVYDAVIEKQSLKSQEALLLLPDKRQKLTKVLDGLKSTKYLSYAKTGGHVTTSDQNEKDNLKKMNGTLNQLAEALSDAFREVLSRSMTFEATRIHDSMQFLIQKITEDFNRKAHETAPDLTSLATTQSILQRESQMPKFPPCYFQSGFPVHSETKDELIGTKREKVGERRVWWTLWIGTEDIMEEKPVYEQRQYNSAVIPGLQNILEDFIKQAKSLRSEDTVTDWLKGELIRVVAGVRRHQENGLKQYRIQLNKAKKEASQMKEAEKDTWDQICALINNLQQKLPKLREVPGNA